MKIQMPYGNSKISVSIPDKNLVQLVMPKLIEPKNREHEIIRHALLNPLGGVRRISKGAKKNDRVAIVVDDIWRACPTNRLLPPVLGELKQAGISPSNITLIFGTGTHKPVKAKDAEFLLGKKIAAKYRWINHDSNHSEPTRIGKTSRGNEVLINKEFADADYRLLLGDVEPHYFAGYGGGRKSILPGISANQTIQTNHKLLFEEGARLGNLDKNPLHEDMCEAAGLAKVSFCLNAVQNLNHQIVGCFGGDLNLVFKEGVKLANRMFRVKSKLKTFDLAVVSAGGSPYDKNLYSVIKAIYSVIDGVKEGGILVLITECKEGHGSKKFWEEITRFGSSEEVKKELLKEFIMGKHKVYYLLKALERVQKILVVTSMSEEMTTHFRLERSKSVAEAISKSFDLLGKDARVLVSPYGSSAFIT